MDDYTVRELALALKGGGWTADDKLFFVEENEKQDEENQLTMEEIDRIFKEMETL